MIDYYEKSHVAQENNEDYEQFKSEAEAYDKRIAELEAIKLNQRGTTQSGQSRAGVTMATTLNIIAFKAQIHPKHRFQNLYGLLNTDSLYQSWGQLKQKRYRR